MKAQNEDNYLRSRLARGYPTLCCARPRTATGGGWGIPVPNHTLQLTLGGIARKPGVIDDRIEIREYLSVTISFDHDIVDGAPAARFVQHLRELVEGGYSVVELATLCASENLADPT
jgi:hypothetical protein